MFMAARIGILGITGRMGRLLAEETQAAGAVLAGGVSRAPRDDGFTDGPALMAASDAVIDFTHADAAIANARAAGTAGVPFVLGTSGLSPEAEREVEAVARTVPVVYAANFAPGVNLVLALAERLREHPRFRGFVHGEATGLYAERGRIRGVETDGGLLTADAYVLAAGIQSRDLAESVGIDLPLYPLKGYSLSAPIRQDDVAPEISVTDFERKVLYARIGDRLRVAAMVDMVGEDLRHDPKRVEGLTRQVRETMPRAADYSQVSVWAGLRPATPSSAPIIGATRYDNLWLNVGHGPLGFTFACGTAAVLADLVQGKAPPFGLDGLTLRH